MFYEMIVKILCVLKFVEYFDGGSLLVLIQDLYVMNFVNVYVYI